MSRPTICVLAAAVSMIVAISSARALQTTQSSATDQSVTQARAPESGASAGAGVPAGALEATVTGVEGLVQVRGGSDQPWRRAAVGMVLNEEAELRTGPKSAVRFTIPPDQTVTLDRLGTVKILEAVNDNGKLKTNLGMKYGRTRYDIEAAGREHESTITSPSSTLAVRGTKVSVTDERPFPAQAVSLTGRAEFRDAKKRVFFGGKGAGKTQVSTDTRSAAGFSLLQSVVDPSIALARTESEQNLVNTLLQSGATIGFDFEKGIRVIRGGTVPTDAQLIPTLPGTLNFVLRWNTPGSDLNLSVVDPGLNGPGTVYPLAGFDLVNSGGKIGFDHRGGPNGGIEIAYWPATFPDGNYQVGAQLMSGPTTPATLDVFLDGQRVNITTAQGTVPSANVTVTPPRTDLGLTGTGIGFVRFSGQQPVNVPGAALPGPRRR
jgi:hypothetical protein